MKLSRLNEQQGPSGFPGAATGGTRTSPGKVMPDKEDLEEKEDPLRINTKLKDEDTLESNIPNDTPEELEKSNIYQPILKEPNDWLKPKWPYKGPDGV